MSKPPRKYRPVHVERDAALNALGLLGKKINYDHDPCLAMRLFDPMTGLYDPDENDPRYIVPRLAEDHDIKTSGDATPLSGDKSKISKLKRNEEKEAAFRAKILAKRTGQPRIKRSRIPSRPFRKRREKK
jgi:hypothetical protein